MLFWMEQKTLCSTSSAFIWSRVLGVPLWVVLSALSLILYKEFHASPLQLTFLVALKPASALFAAYWSSFRRKNLVTNLVLTNILRFVPFLGFYWIHSAWFLIFAFGWYMILSRGCVPTWMELFKKHLPSDRRSKIFVLGNALEYVGTALLPLLLGILLDHNGNAWRYIFPITGLIGIASTFFFMQIPEAFSQNVKAPSLILPWKQSLTLLLKNPDFFRYQIGFMIGGAGLMIMQPVLPIFFVDHLHLSYTKILLALSVCKGIGFAATSSLWSNWFNKTNLFVFSALVAFLAALFPPLLLAAKMTMPLLFFAYLNYGIMQAGSELSWHLSAISFAKEDESLPFSEANILAVGVRGCIVPFIGSLIFVGFNAATVLWTASLLCLTGSITLLLSQKVLAQKPVS